MIFYFTGTGNSLFAAKRLLSEGEALINIADAIKKNEYEYGIEEGGKVGFVFPVYFYTVPEIVSDFVSKLRLHGVKYMYAVITCGGSIAQTGAVLGKRLSEKGHTLNYVTPLLMPDNGMLFYQIPTAEEAKGRLADAEKRLAEISADIKAQKNTAVSGMTFISDLVGLGFKLCEKTAKFYARESCTGCGLCEGICPVDAIKLQSGKPQWVKEKCTKCSACINRCPQKAIQYGSKTESRNRYVNPEI